MLRPYLNVIHRAVDLPLLEVKLTYFDPNQRQKVFDMEQSNSFQAGYCKALGFCEEITCVLLSKYSMTVYRRAIKPNTCLC